MEISEVINPLISLLAVILSVVSLVRSRKNTKKMIELEEVHAQLSRKQLEEYEERERESLKANIGVRLETEGSSGRFVVENSGPAIAKNIHFSLTQDGEHNPLVGGDYKEKSPFPILNAGDSYYFLASFPLEVTQMIYGVELRWHTEDGIQHKKSFSVSR